MRVQHDQRQKGTLRALLERAGTVQTEEEISPAPQRIDLWFVPDPSLADARAALGTLGALAAQPCSFETFSRAPSESEALECIRKHLAWRHLLATRPERTSEARSEPMLWILCAGRPDEAIRALGGAHDPTLRGAYRLAPSFRTGIVALNELERSRDTLLLRLLSRGASLLAAIGELARLGPESLERRTVAPILLRWRLIAAQSVNPDDQEFVMQTTDLYLELEQELQLKGLQIGIEKGRAEGIERGRAEGIERGRAEGRAEGELRIVQLMCEHKLRRAIDERELTALADKLARLGEPRVASAVLDLAADELARWLADADAT